MEHNNEQAVSKRMRWIPDPPDQANNQNKKSIVHRCAVCYAEVFSICPGAFGGLPEPVP